MFATLVIQLSAEHKGGKLVMQHNGKHKTFDLADDSASDVFFAKEASPTAAASKDKEV